MIVLGCTVIGPIAAKLADHFNVSVIELGTATLKIAEAFAAPKWCLTLLSSNKS